jgi:predicted dehydrogenase
MKIEVGLIGCGDITHRHVEGWNAISDRAEIVAVADISEENAKRRVEQIGHPVKIYSDYRDLLAQGGIDAVDICLPHYLHRDAIVAAAESGKHIMCEKPLCLTLEEAEDIREAVESSGVRMMAAHNQLFYPSMLQAKQMIAFHELGEVYAIHSIGTYGSRRNRLGMDKSTWGKPSNRWAHTWRADLQKSGGGHLIDGGYHATYRLVYLAGERPTEVVAMLSGKSPRRDHSAEVLVRFESGMIGRVFSTSAMRGPGRNSVLFNVFGELGQLWSEVDKSGTKFYHQPMDSETPATREYPDWRVSKTIPAEIVHFVDAIEGGFEPLHSVKEATDVLRIVLAAYRSEEEGIVVKL